MNATRQWRVCAETTNQIRRGLVGKNRVGSPNACLAVLERIPRESKAWLKVLGIVVIDRPDARVLSDERDGHRIEHHETIESLCWRSVPVVTETQLERYVGPPFVVVLNV